MSKVLVGAGVDDLRILFGGIYLFGACFDFSYGGFGFSLEFSLSRKVMPLLLPWKRKPKQD